MCTQCDRKTIYIYIRCICCHSQPQYRTWLTVQRLRTWKAPRPVPPMLCVHWLGLHQPAPVLTGASRRSTKRRRLNQQTKLLRTLNYYELLLWFSVYVRLKPVCRCKLRHRSTHTAWIHEQKLITIAWSLLSCLNDNSVWMALWHITLGMLSQGQRRNRKLEWQIRKLGRPRIRKLGTQRVRSFWIG